MDQAAKQVTVKDIAEQLQLHYTTVSKALRDHPDISAVTKRRVTSLAEELGYSPNPIARSLKTQVTSTIGVIVPSIRNDFFAAVISGIEEVAGGAEFNTVLCQSNESTERERIHVRTLISHRVAGVLASVARTTVSGEHFAMLAQHRIPLIFFDRVCDGPDVGRVIADDYEGALMVVRHLIERGYRRIAHFAGPESTSIGRERRRGYEDALTQAGIDIEPQLIIEGGFEEQDGIEACRRVMSQDPRPDAVFAVNDMAAVGAYQYSKSLGLRIPDDFALAGFGDNVMSPYLTPPLTTVAQFPHEQGRIAARMLLSQIGGTTNETPQLERIRTELIIREST